MTVFILRHGESLASQKRSIFSEMDPVQVPLTEWGHEQTVEAGKALRKLYEESPELRGRKLRVYYSPHFRIVQSKDGFLTGLGRENCSLIQEHELLAERDHGDFNGLPPSKQKIANPDAYELLENGTEEEKFRTPMPNGESIADVQTRMQEFINTVIKSTPENEDVMIISHGGNCKLLEHLLVQESTTFPDFESPPQYAEILKITKIQEHGDSETVFSARQRPELLKHFKTQPHYPALGTGIQR